MYLRNNSEYNNSRVINYNRWSTCREVDALVNELSSYIVSRKKVGFKHALKVLILDLYQSYIADPEQYIGYFRDMDHYHFKVKAGVDDRYIVNPHMTYFYLIGAADILIVNKYVKHKRGSHFEDAELGDYGYLSKMRATEKLALLWQKHGFTTDMIQKFKQEEVIIQKDFPVEEKVKDRKTGKDKTVKKKYEFLYKDTEESNRMRELVLAYNRQLDFTHIDCDAECISDADRDKLIKSLKAYKKEPIIRVDLSSKNVYRVFNNRSFEQGGRFYGAWWIGCPSLLRKYITINGDPAVELDYSGIHIHLLYAMKGINYAKRKEYPYDLDDGLPDRKLNKLILLTALNAESETDARDSVYNQLRKEGRLGDYDFKRSKLPITKKLTLLRAKHPDIDDGIASGMGIKLQYYDSCIIEKLISYGIKSKIPILTIHDSVICQAKHSELIQDKMWQFYADLLSAEFNCNIRYHKYVPHAGNIIRILPALSEGYKPPTNYSMYNPLYQRYMPSLDVVTDILRSDDIIKIDSKNNRTNVCSGKCKHGTRITNYKNNMRNYLETIKIKLIGGDTVDIRG